VVSLRLALSNPTLPENTGDHRYAARSLQHLEGALASGFASPSYTTRRDTISGNVQNNNWSFLKRLRDTHDRNLTGAQWFCARLQPTGASERQHAAQPLIGAGE
jgi:hypothetical protein